MLDNTHFLLVMTSHSPEWVRYNMDDVDDLLVGSLVPHFLEIALEEGITEATKRIGDELRKQIEAATLGVVFRPSPIEGCKVDTAAKMVLCRNP